MRALARLQPGGERGGGIRPLDRLGSIRAKLGSVIVFAVAVTIVIMYLTVGFALRSTQDRQQLLNFQHETQAVAAAGFTDAGVPTGALIRVLRQYGRQAVVLNALGQPVLEPTFPVPTTIDRTLQSGRPDSGIAGDLEYYGVPVIRDRRIVGAVYLARPAESGGWLGPVRATASFVRSWWLQLLIAGAVSAFLALLLARLLARGMTQPVRDMAAAAQRLARGEYGERVPVESRDELGRLAETFNRMAGELENVERLRRDLVANVSHELKTPISALRAHLENLLDGVEKPDREVLQVMLEQTERLTRLIEGLLDLSRLESGSVTLELEPVRLGPLVRQVAREVEIARPGVVSFHDEIPAGLPPMAADRGRLHQVLFNLLDNAYRFTAPGGTVTVRATERDGSCEVSVDDSGPGIPDEHLPFVFERFYRVDSSRSRGDGGTGIGLTIAKTVVEAHGGRIWAERRPEGGSRFRFVLPAGTDDGLATPEDVPAARPLEAVREAS
jgi:signal transduction histidine kinase